MVSIKYKWYLSLNYGHLTHCHTTGRKLAIWCTIYIHSYSGYSQSTGSSVVTKQVSETIPFPMKKSASTIFPLTLGERLIQRTSKSSAREVTAYNTYVDGHIQMIYTMYTSIYSHT